jgi:hypothetical protein
MSGETFSTPPPIAEEETSGAPTRWPSQSTYEIRPAPGGANGSFSTPPPEERRKESAGVDIAKSAGAQAVFGLGDIATLPGTLGDLASQGLDWVGRKTLEGADKIGLLPGEHTPETVPRSIAKWWEGLATPEAKKYAEKYGSRGDLGITSAPTSEEAEKLLRKQIPALDYTPQTKAGEYAGSGARMGVNALAGGPGRTMAEQVLIGTAAGLGSEAAGDVAKTFGAGDYEGPARFLGAVLTNAAAARTAGGIRAYTGKNAEAESRLARALQEDLRDGKAKMSPQQIEEAHQAGHSPSIFDMAGPRTEELLSRMGGMSPQKLGQLNAGILARNEAMRTANGQFITDAFGLTNRAGDEMAALQLAHKRQNDQLYRLARTEPSAAAVTTPRLEELARYDAIKPSLARVTKLAEDPQFGIQPPIAAPSFGGPPMAATPGNLNFWDHVKRDIDAQINTLKRSGGDTHYLDTWRKELLHELDGQVKGYDAARANARVGFQAEDALEAGTKFAAKPNSFQTADIKKTLAGMSPEEREMFVKGVGDTLLTKAQAAPQTFVKYLSQPENAERLRAALGDAKYSQLHGHARNTELLSNASTIMATPPPKSWLSGHAGLTAAIGASVMELIPYTAGLPAGAAAKILAGVAFDQATKSIKYAAERRIAPEVVRLAQSSDPTDVARLGALLQSNPAANAYFGRVTTSLAELAATGTRSQAGMQDQPRPQRKAGGRIGGINHGSIAMSLIRAAEKAKKGHNTTTEPLLEQPDEAITKALSIAEEALS